MTTSRWQAIKNNPDAHARLNAWRRKNRKARYAADDKFKQSQLSANRLVQVGNDGELYFSASVLKNKAKQRGRRCTCTQADMPPVPKQCNGCGVEITPFAKANTPTLPSVDRFDPAFDYHNWNINGGLCRRCNTVKSDMYPWEMRRLLEWYEKAWLERQILQSANDLGPAN